MPSEDAELTHFLNVDFDVECDRNIAELASALNQRTFVLHRTDAFVSFELNQDRENVQTCLDAFIRVIDGLAPKARSIWDGCSRRTANIGIQAGRQPHSAAFPISHETIVALAAIGCGIEFTVYAVAK